MVSTCIDGE